jgi:hypothetical protein
LFVQELSDVPGWVAGRPAAHLFDGIELQIFERNL